MGEWSGHTRLLRVSSSGRVTESIDDGCCTQVIDVTLQLGEPRQVGSGWAAPARVLTVAVHPGWGTEQPAPRVGQRATLTLRGGVLSESATAAIYCGSGAAPGTCGA